MAGVEQVSQLFQHNEHVCIAAGVLSLFYYMVYKLVYIGKVEISG